MKVSRYEAPPESPIRDDGGVSILFVPDATYKVLSDEAAKRNLTVPALVALAVQAYLLPAGPAEPPEPRPPPGKSRPVLKRFV